MFADLGQTLPLSTRMMLADQRRGDESLVTHRRAGDPRAPSRALPLLLRRRSGWPSTRSSCAIPLLGNLLRLTEVARFGRTLGVLLRSGVPMLQALDIVRAVAANQVIAQALTRCRSASAKAPAWPGRSGAAACSRSSRCR